MSGSSPTPLQKVAGRPRGSRLKWRPWLRALHRDIGYFAVGLTLIYAISGIAVNHIADWNPNFHEIRREHTLSLPATGSDEEVARAVLTQLEITSTPSDIYRAAPESLDITLPDRTLHVDPTTGKVFEEGEQARWFLRVANWLHLNRGKKAWTYVADGYAGFLLYLSISGLFMIPGRKGLRGRGAVLAGAGVLLPVLYVTFSGGP